MRKITSIISAVVLSTSLLPGTVMAANGADYSTDFSGFENGGVAFEGWTFNGASTPWFSSSTFCEDAATSVVADKDVENANLKLVPSGGNLAGAIYDAGITSGVYKVSFRLKKSDAAAVRVRLTDTIGETASEALYITPYENITGPDGKNPIRINQNGDTVHVTADEWSNFEFIVNQNTKKILRFADGRGIMSADTLALENIDKILICASDADVWIDDFSVTKLTDETEYSEPTVADDLLNTNFTQYIDHAFNTKDANNNDNLTLGNAAWRGGAYTVLTDRGVSMKLTRTSYNGNNELYFTLPTSISTGVGVTEVYIKPVTTAGVSNVANMQIQVCGTFNGNETAKALTTDTSGKVTAFKTPKDKNGIDLKLNMNEWNKIELVNDLNNDKVYAFVNGYGCGSTGNGSDTFTKVKVIASNNNACDVYVDDLRVYVDEDSLYNAPDKTGYIENENFTAAAKKVSNNTTNCMNFNNFTFGNAAWRGSVHATKTDKGISLCIGDPTGNTLANKWNDVTWTPTEALAGTDGKYVIEFDEYYDDAVTCKMIIDVNGSTSSQKTEFAVSDDGGVVGGNGANFISGQWNHAKITVDLNAKTAVFNINGIDVKTVNGIANTDIKSLYIKTAESAGGNHGDIIIDDFTVKYVMPMVIEKTATGAAVTFSADSNVKTVIASYDANGVLLGTKMSDASTNGKVEIQRAEGVKQYKAFMWNKVDGDGSMVPACRHISIDE